MTIEPSARIIATIQVLTIQHLERRVLACSNATIVFDQILAGHRA